MEGCLENISQGYIFVSSQLNSDNSLAGKGHYRTPQETYWSDNCFAFLKPVL
jgi:hypothetical protein